MEKHLAKISMYAIVNNTKIRLSFPTGTYTDQTYNDFVYSAPSFWQAVNLIQSDHFPNVSVKYNLFKHPRIVIRGFDGHRTVTARNFKKLCFIISYEKWEPTYAELKKELPIKEFMDYFGDRKF